MSRVGGFQSTGIVYGRSGNPVSCNHALFAHVTYDGKVYRAKLRCKCTKRIVIGKTTHNHYKEAEQDAADMLKLQEQGTPH